MHEHKICCECYCCTQTRQHSAEVVLMYSIGCYVMYDIHHTNKCPDPNIMVKCLLFGAFSNSLITLVTNKNLFKMLINRIF